MPYLLNCPKCGARLRVQDDAPATLTCPRCLAVVPLVAPPPTAVSPAPADVLPSIRQRPLPSFRLADADVRRDTGSTAAALGLLGLLLLVALILTFTSGFTTGRSFWKSTSVGNTIIPLTLLLTLLVVMAAPAPVVVRLFRKHDVGAGRVALGCLLYVGVFITTVVGLCVVFFLACVVGLSGK